MKKLLLSATLLFSFLAFTNAQSGFISFDDAKSKFKIKKIEISNEDGSFERVGRDVAAAFEASKNKGSSVKVTIRKRDFKSFSLFWSYYWSNGYMQG